MAAITITPIGPLNACLASWSYVTKQIYQCSISQLNSSNLYVVIHAYVSQPLLVLPMPKAFKEKLPIVWDSRPLLLKRRKKRRTRSNVWLSKLTLMKHCSKSFKKSLRTSQSYVIALLLQWNHLTSKGKLSYMSMKIKLLMIPSWDSWINQITSTVSIHW